MSVTTMAPADIHRRALEADIADLAADVQAVLSRKLTAFAVGVPDARTVSRWASREVRSIPDHLVEERLRTTWEICQLLTQDDAPATIKAWFIGLNPILDDISPAEAIHDGRSRDALRAARAFIVNG